MPKGPETVDYQTTRGLENIEDINVDQELGDLMEEVLEDNQDLKDKKLEDLTDEDIQELLGNGSFDSLKEQRQELLEDMKIKSKLNKILYKYDVNVGEMSIAKAMQLYEGISILKKNNPKFLKALFLGNEYEENGETVQIDGQLPFDEVEKLMLELTDTQTQRELLEYQSIIEDRQALKSIESKILRGEISKALKQLQNQIESNESVKGKFHSKLAPKVDKFFGKDFGKRFDQLFIDVKQIGTFENKNGELVAFRTVREKGQGTELGFYNDDRDIAYSFDKNGLEVYSMKQKNINEKIRWSEIENQQFEDLIDYFENLVDQAKDYQQKEIQNKSKK